MTFATYPSLKGRVVFVTGGATGIGADIVAAFVRNGARVAFFDRQREAGKSLAAGLAPEGEAPLFIEGDVTDIPGLQEAIARVGETLGPIGVLVNNAANDQRRDVDEVDVAFWDASQAVNLRHQFFASQAVHAQMKARGGGSIVNLSSIAWRIGAAEMAVYATAKSAVVGLTRSLARAFGPDDIRVNAIEPGAVMTQRQRELWYKTQGAVDAMTARQILGRTLLGEEIARAVLFLAADDSRMITKQTLTVDAGLR